MEEFFGQALALSEYPGGLPPPVARYTTSPRSPRASSSSTGCRPVTVIPSRPRNYGTSRHASRSPSCPGPLKDVEALYASVIYRWRCGPCGNASASLRPTRWWIRSCSTALSAATDRATGRAEELHLVSTPASRAEFAQLVLDQVDHTHVPEAPQGDPVAPTPTKSLASSRSSSSRKPNTASPTRSTRWQASTRAPTC